MVKGARTGVPGDGVGGVRGEAESEAGSWGVVGLLWSLTCLLCSWEASIVSVCSGDGGGVLPLLCPRGLALEEIFHRSINGKTAVSQVVSRGSPRLVQSGAC